MLEVDGTEVEDDDVLAMLSKDDVIMVLAGHQQWEGTVITVNIQDEEQSRAIEVDGKILS